MNYTYEEFAERHGLTVNQAKFNTIRRKFDSIKTKEGLQSQRGGAKVRRLIVETEKTLAQVEKIKKLNKAGTGYNTDNGGSKFKRYESMIFSYNGR
jgi:hypothetical protein